jgi:hypothetical protein
MDAGAELDLAGGARTTKQSAQLLDQAQTMPLNSTAGPLPTGETGTRFPLTAGSARCIQEADFDQIFDADPAILGCVNTVFRCRQRNCGGALRRSASDRQMLVKWLRTREGVSEQNDPGEIVLR